MFMMKASDSSSDSGRALSPSSLGDIDGLKLPGGKLCCVCGDKALSCNFGAISCESCKAFFRRNALKSIAAKCSGNCIVTVASRAHCKRCRLTKCISVGMRKDLILSDEQKHHRKQKIMENKYKRLNSEGPYPSVSCTSHSHMSSDVMSQTGNWPISLNSKPPDFGHVSDVTAGIFHNSVSYPTSQPYGHYYNNDQVKEQSINYMDKLTPGDNALLPWPYDVWTLRHPPSLSPGSTGTLGTQYASSPIDQHSYTSTGSATSTESEDMIDLSAALLFPGHPSVVMSLGQDYIETNQKSATDTNLATIKTYSDSDVSTASEQLLQKMDSLSSEIIGIQPPIYSPCYNKVFNEFKSSCPSNNVLQWCSQLQNAAMIAFCKPDNTLKKSKCPNNPNYLQLFNNGEDRFKHMVSLAKQLLPFIDLPMDDQIVLLKCTVLNMIVLHSSLSFDPLKKEWVVAGEDDQPRRVSSQTAKNSNYGALLMCHYELIAMSTLAASRRDLGVHLLMLVLALFDISSCNEKLSDWSLTQITLVYRHYKEVLRLYTNHFFPERKDMAEEVLCIIRMGQNFTDTYLRAIMQVPLEAISPLIVEVFNLDKK